MKKILFIGLSILALSVQAQEVSTLYFLDNAPMRHLMNPSFQPVSNGYVNLTPLGYLSTWDGNNSLTLSDVLYAAPNGAMVTPLHPEYGDKDKVYNVLRNPVAVYTSNNLNLVGFGFRIKQNGYFTFGASIKCDDVTRLPRDLFQYTLEGGKADLAHATTLNLSAFGSNTQLYSEIAGGYSHKINEFWTVGGKLKFLMGTAYIGLQHKDLTCISSKEQMSLQGDGDLMLAGPLNLSALPDKISYESLQNYDYSQLLYDNSKAILDVLLDYIRPAGYGAAVDLGVTVHPIKQLQLSVAINDLGFIYWNNGAKYHAVADTTFAGLGELEYKDYVENNQFSTDKLSADIEKRLMRLGMSYTLQDRQYHFMRMVTSKLNIGVDGQFFDNRLDVGVLSKTFFYNNYISEEITFGLAGKPFHWLNLAVSYSLIDNGKCSDIGAGLSLMPYDGINLTLAMDYIPTCYAQKDGKAYYPSRTKGINLALGFSIVWGTNPKKEKKAKVAKAPEPGLEPKR